MFVIETCKRRICFYIRRLITTDMCISRAKTVIVFIGNSGTVIFFQGGSGSDPLLPTIYEMCIVPDSVFCYCFIFFFHLFISAKIWFVN